MPALKRFNSGNTDASSQPAKRSKNQDEMTSSDPLLVAEARIRENRSRISMVSSTTAG